MRVHVSKRSPVVGFFAGAFFFGAVIGPVLGAPSVGLIDFNVSNGDLVVVSTNNPPGPWGYDATRGSWAANDTADCATAPRSSRLNSPAWTVVASGPVTLTFAHRHSFEVDTTRWDGGQLRLSVNGGPYVMVPSTSFSANGYNNTIGGAAVPTSELAGQLAFTAESAGYSDGIFIESVARLGTFNAGDTLSIQFLAAWDDCSQGLVPNWEIASIQFTPSLEDRRPPPSFANASLPVDAGVVEGTPYTLQAVPVGYTSLQWYKDGIAIPSATGSNYTIVEMSAADAGQYQLEAFNAIGTTPSRLANITLVPDTVAPRLVLAFGDATDLTRFTIWVSEPVCTDEFQCGSDADDSFNYRVESVDGLEALEVAQVIVSDATNVTLITSTPRTPGRSYRILADRGSGIGDRYRNVIPPGPLSQIIVSEPVVFQQGLNGYLGTDDTELRGAAPGTPQSNNPFVTVDTADGGGVSQGLLRFASVFGSSAGQIPAGSIIYSARLTLTHSASGAPGSLVNVHRMLIPWDEATATFNSMVGGVSANGIEARATADFQIVSTGVPAGGKLTFDGTAAVQAWANGEANYGWAFIPTADDGYRWDTSEGAAGTQPRLEVLFSLPPCAPVAITQQPAASTTVNEGGAFTLAVTVTSQGCPPTFQWTRNGTDIPGATDSSYGVVNATPTQHSGTYRVRVSNALPSSVLSAPAQVTVVADTTKPVVASAYGDPDLVTIIVVFSEAVGASAESAGNYSLVAAVGGGPLPLTISRVSPTTIKLTTAARPFGSFYVLSISGVTDLASAPNTMVPVAITLGMTARRLLSSDAGWKYDQINNYDNTLAAGATPWYATAFDDSAWSSGAGMFGLETATVIAAVPLPNPLIRTPWTISATQLAYYLRTSFNVPSAPGGSLLILRHATDDGMVAYVDGIEKARYNMGTISPVLHDQLAPAASPEGIVTCSALPGVVAGVHTLAVEVHQSATASSDVVFGAELLQVMVPSVQLQPAANGAITLTWPNDPGWQLVQASTVTGPYVPITPSPTSPFTLVPGATVFYQLQCR